MRESERPSWQLPPGVSRSLWEYVHSYWIASDYDNYFAHHRLFELDKSVLNRYLCPGRTVVDLGCGTGRALIPLVRRGLKGVAVDLSRDMLDIVQEKSDRQRLEINCVQANMVELDWLTSASVDYVICLFSTLGMIQGAENRRRALAHIRRILKPDGLFVLHVHNFWFNLFDPGGPWWVLKNFVRSALFRDIERGDKFFPYRGIPNMFLHVFTYREITSLLRTAKLHVIEPIHLNPARRGPLSRPWLFKNIRANGWILVSRPV